MRYKLYDCIWELTLGCCFSCSHCGSKAGRARANELTLSECLDVVHQLSDLGCKRVSLIGGEVFLYNGWEIVAEFLAREGIRTSIITNGYLIDEKIIQQMKSAFVRHVSVSIDGAELHHDRTRVKGSYQKAISAIKQLKQEGFLVSVITTLQQGNINDLEYLYETFCELGIDAWQLQNCLSMGNAAGMNTPDLPAQKQIHQFVAQKARTGILKIGLAHNVGYFSEEETWVRGSPLGKQVFRGCSAGLSTVAIDSVGNVRGCEALYDEQFIEGNVRERTLYDIWHDKSAFSYNRTFRTDRLTGACKNCKFSKQCAGGCRAMNFFSSQNLYESHKCVIAHGDICSQE